MENRLSMKIDLLVEGLASLHKEVISIKDEVRSIKKSIKSKEIENSVISQRLPTLPLSSMSDLRKMEEVLKIETERKIFINLLSNFGGSHLNGLVNNMMNKVLTREVACQLSMQGRSGKKMAFSTTKICACILGK